MNSFPVHPTSDQILAICQQIAESMERFRGATFHWSVVGPDNQAEFSKIFQILRSKLSTLLASANRETVREIFTLEHGPLSFAWFLCNTLKRQALDAKEQARLSRARKAITKDPCSSETLRALMIFVLYRQPMELRKTPTIYKIDENLLRSWVRILLMHPSFHAPLDEQQFVEFHERILDSLLRATDAIRQRTFSYREVFFQAVRDFLTFGATFFIDYPVGRVMRKRGKLIKEMRDWFGDDAAVVWEAPTRPPRRKARIGILTRNLLNYTDTMVIYGHFNAFDRDKYEIYIYSLEIDDLNGIHNVPFYRDLWNIPIKVVRLWDDLKDSVRLIREDDLDFFVLATAYIGLELLISHRLARIQMALNSLLPSTTGLQSFDVMATSSLGLKWLIDLPQEATEDVVAYDFPLLCYRRHPPVSQPTHIGRADFGIPDDAVMYYNFHSIQKLVPSTLRCWISVLDQVPSSVLVLSPYNPAWGDSAHAAMFENRLREALEDFPRVSRDRIIVTGVLHPSVSESLLLLCNVFLGSFPHGGATAMTMCLSHAIPCVVRASPWLRGTADATMIAASHLPELVGANNADYTQIAVDLGRDPAKRRAIREKMAVLGPASPVFDLERGSNCLQTLFDVLRSERLCETKYDSLDTR